MEFIQNRDKSNTAVDSIKKSDATGFASMVVTRILVLLIVGLRLMSGINVVQAQEVDLESGLVAYYPFNGNANDESGNGNHGDVNGAALVKNRFGIDESAYSFAGTRGEGQYIDLGKSDMLILSEDFSICAWVYQVGGAADSRIISYGQDGGVELLVNGGGNSHIGWVEGNYAMNFGGHRLVAKNPYAREKWHFVVGLQSGSSRKLYIDGKLEAVDSGQKTADLWSESMNIGRKSDMNNDLWGGYIDDVRIYSRALSDSEINALYKLESQPDPLTYEIEGNSVTITDCDESYKGELVIPSSYQGKPVTKIKSYAFEGRVRLASVTIPDSVTSIGANPFHYCDNLKSIKVSPGNIQYSSDNGVLFNKNKTTLVVFPKGKSTNYTIPEGISSIAGSAFSGCNRLKTVTIADSVTSIGDLAFQECEELTHINVGIANTQYSSVDGVLFNKDKTILILFPKRNSNQYTIPDGVTSIGVMAFVGCDFLQSVTLPDTVVSIRDTAFMACHGLTNIKIPDSVTSIGYEAFRDCTGLTSVTIPNSVTSIGETAFRGCSSLTSVTIPNPNCVIAENAFDPSVKVIQAKDPLTYKIEGNSVTITDCDKNFEGDLVIPSSYQGKPVTKIGVEAIYRCENITSVIVPNTVKEIGQSAFRYMYKLENVYFPDSVQSIGVAPFVDCLSLNKIHVDSKNNHYKSIDGALFTKDGKILLKVPETWNGDYEIPDSVTRVERRALDGSKLSTINIPSSVWKIGSGSFSSMINLVSIKIPDSVLNIEGSFSKCLNLKNIELSNKLETIGGESFKGCTNLDSIIIPSTVDSIGEYAFAETGLTSITIPNPNCIIDENAFDEGVEIIRSYYDAPLTYLVEGEGVTVIDCDEDYAGELVIPDTFKGKPVTEIGKDAFIRCHELKSVTIPNSVTTLRQGAFRDCKGLSEVIMPNSVKVVEESAFRTAISLKSITLPDSVTSIGEGAFNNCINLKYVTIGAGITEISSFFNGTIIENLVISKNVQRVVRGAFSGMASLKSIDVAAGNKWYTSVDGVLFNKSKTDLIRFPAGKGTDYGIPAGTELIGPESFKNSKILQTVSIPSSVKIIDYRSFEGSGIKEVIIPEGVETIGNSAFVRSDNLVNVIFPKSLKKISSNSFRLTGLTEVYIPNANCKIEEGAFDPSVKVIQAKNPGELVWKVDIGNLRNSTPSADSIGNIIVISSSGALISISSLDGAENWRFKPNQEDIKSYYAGYATIDGADNIYFSNNGKTYSVDASSGRKNWEASLSSNFTALGYNDDLFAASGKILYKLNKTNGDIVWEYNTQADFKSPSIDNDGNVVLSNKNGNIYSINPSSGKSNWIFPTGVNLGTAEISIDSNGHVFAGGPAPNKFYAINSKTGQKLWESQFGEIDQSGSIDNLGNVYFGNNNGSVYSVNTSNGGVNWEYDAGAEVQGTPVIGENGLIYVGSRNNNTFHAINSKNGRNEWKFSADGKIWESSPLLDKFGKVFFTADDGFLYCLQTSSTGPADSPWPMFGQNQQRTGRAYDSDSDSLPDYKERQLGTNPDNNDSDSDGVLDNYEIVQGSDPLDSNSTLPQSGAPGITINNVYATQEKIQVLDQASIKIQSAFSNATILYTVDGSDPSEGNVYEGPITLNQSASLRAIAFSEDFSQQAEALYSYQIEVLSTFKINAATPGGGTVTVTPTLDSYPDGTTVTITASPDEGWKFIGWEGLSEDTVTVELTVSENLNVSALFGGALTVSKLGKGDIQIVPEKEHYPYGSTVDVYAQPADGYYLSRWVVGSEGSLPVTTVVVNQPNQKLTGLFGKLPAGKVSLGITIVGEGSVAVEPNKNLYDKGEQVTLTATPEGQGEFLGYSGGVVAEERITTFAMSDQVNAEARFFRLPTKTGEIMWKYTGSRQLPTNPVILNKNKLVFKSDKIYCVHQLTGEIIWSYSKDIGSDDWHFGSLTVLKDGNLIYTNTGGVTSKIDSVNGNQIWKSILVSGSGNNRRAIELSGNSALTYLDNSEERIVVSGLSTDDRTGYAICLRTSNGSVAWRKKIGTDSIGSNIASSNGRIYLPNMDGSVYCLDSFSGEIVWTFNGPQDWVNSNGSPQELKRINGITIGPDNRIIFGARNGVVYCLDGATGELSWKREGLGMITNSLIIDYENIFVFPESTTAYSLAAIDGSIIWKSEGIGPLVQGTPLLMDNSSIFKGSTEGYYEIINSKNGKVLWKSNSIYGDIRLSPLAGSKNIVFVRPKDNQLIAFHVPGSLAKSYWPMFNQNKEGTGHLNEIVKPFNPNDGLIAYYPFNGNANDESGNNNQMEVNGATLTDDRFGEISSAYSFDGDDFIRSVKNSWFKDNEPRTISFWHKNTSYKQVEDSKIITLGSYEGTAFQIGVIHRGDEGKDLWFTTDNYDDGELKQVKSELHYSHNDFNWHFITATYDGSNIIIYDKGKIAGQNKFNLKTNENAPLIIGADRNDNNKPPGTAQPFGKYYKGVIDDVRIYNRALSESEVVSLYNLEKPDPLTYTIAGGEVAITDCVENFAGELEIPSTYQGKPVTSVGDNAFENCSSLTSVIIPEGVKFIGRYAFNGSPLTSVVIPNSVISIGRRAFLGTALESVKIPDSVILIDNEAFGGTPLKTVTIGRSVTFIGHGAFGGTQLTSVTIPYADVRIRKGAFPASTAVNFGQVDNKTLTVTAASKEDFPELTDGHTIYAVTIPNTVNSIVNEAFTRIGYETRNTFSLETVVIPNSVVSIGYAAFHGTQLKEVVIPNSVKSIGDYAFYRTPLKSVVIPNSVTSIGRKSFYEVLLKTVEIPDSVTSIGEKAFLGTPLTSVVIPDSVTSIESSTFQVTELETVTIPRSVTSIGELAFAGTKLTEVRIPNPNTVIAGNAFDPSVKIIREEDQAESPLITGFSGTEVAISGQAATFSVTASGTAPLSYQWKRNGTAIAGATSSTLQITGVQQNDAGAYSVLVSNEAGSVESDSISLSIHYTVQVAVNGPGKVSISPDQQSYASGTKITLKATPDEGYMLGSWKGATGGDGSSLSVTINKNLNITAEFVEVPEAINRIFVNDQLVEEGKSISVADKAGIRLETAYAGGKILYTINNGRPLSYNNAFVVEANSSIVVTSYSSDFSETSVSKPVQINILPSWAVSVSSTGGGTATLVNVGDSFIEGTEITVTSEAEAGWQFMGWEGDLISNNASYTFQITQDTNLKAVFGTKVNLNAAPPGSGSIQLQPESDFYAHGRTYTVQAIPSNGYYFGRWSHVDSQASPVEYEVLESNQTLTGLFLPLAAGDVSLTPLVAGDGFVKLGADQNVFSKGTKVTLEAVARPGAFFTGWSGEATGTDTKITVTMDKSKVITANFSQGFTISTSSENGSILIEPTLPTYPSGTEVTITAKPDKQYAFAGWTGDLSGNKNPIKLKMNKDLNVGANFGAAFKLDTLIAKGKGEIKLLNDKNQFINERVLIAGSKLVLVATPGEGFEFEKWDFNGLTLTERVTKPFDLTEDMSASVFFKDTQNPKVTIVEPVGGMTGNENIDLRGLVQDNGTVGAVNWFRGDKDQGALELAEDKFNLKGIVLEKGENSYTVVARDVEGNESSETVTVTWEPLRTLITADAPERREGKRVNVPIKLNSKGDVGGMTFILNYDKELLKDPVLVWSSAAGASFNVVNTDVAGEVKATISIPEGIPAGDQLIATVSFRVRSVPSDLYTDYSLEILDLTKRDGSQANFGTFVEAGKARLLKRKYNGDGNGNDRLDIGDGTLVQRLLAGFEEQRSWDSTGNDLNGNGKLDSGDVTLLLRTVVGLDKQPSSGNRIITKMEPRRVIRMGGGDDEEVEMAALQVVEQADKKVKLQVLSRNLATKMSGISFTLKFPQKSIKMLDSAGDTGSGRYTLSGSVKYQTAGGVVPEKAVAIINVFADEVSERAQSGKVRVALSNVDEWEASNGVLAEFEMKLEEGASVDDLELGLADVELTPRGYDNRILPDVILPLGDKPSVEGPEITKVSTEPLSFSFKTAEGVKYDVEASGDLREWKKIRSVQGTGEDYRFTDNREALFEQQYYRVRMVE